MNYLSKKKVAFFLLFLLVIPMILSIVLKFSLPFDVAGETADWIGFWGSYLGTIFAFIILWFTLEANSRENKRIIDFTIQEDLRLSKIESNRKLRHDIDERLKKYSSLKVVQDLLFGENKEISLADAKPLETYKLELINDYNSFLILHDGECDEFTREYMKLRDKYVKNLDEIIALICDYVNECNDSERKRIRHELTDQLRLCTALEEPTQQLWATAQVEIKKHPVV